MRITSILTFVTLGFLLVGCRESGGDKKNESGGDTKKLLSKQELLGTWEFASQRYQSGMNLSFDPAQPPLEGNHIFQPRESDTSGIGIQMLRHLENKFRIDLRPDGSASVALNDREYTGTFDVDGDALALALKDTLSKEYHEHWPVEFGDDGSLWLRVRYNKEERVKREGDGWAIEPKGNGEKRVIPMSDALPMRRVAN